MNGGPTLARQNERLTVTLAHLLVGLMALCFGLVCVLLAESAAPGWDGRGMIPACALAILEASLTTWLLKKREMSPAQTFAYRLAEWVILLILLKLFAEARFGFIHLADNLRALGQNFWSSLLSREFVTAAVIVFAVWQVCVLFNRAIAEMEITYLTFAGDSPPPVAPETHQPFQETLGRHFLLTGGLIALLGGLSLQADSARPLLQAQVTAVIVAYFALGLILLGLTNFTSLATFWRYNRVRMAPHLSIHWVMYSLVFLAVLVGVALWLPTHYKLGLLDTLRILIGYLMAFVAGIYYLILVALVGLQRLASRLFGIAAPASSPPPPPAFEPQQYLQPSGQPIGQGDILNSLFFWAIFIAVLVFAFRQFLMANPQLAAILRRFGLVRFLASLWGWMKTALGQTSEGAAAAIRRGLSRLRRANRGPGVSAGRGYVSLRRLPPRQKVFFYYLALLRRAGEAGAPRQDWQTPYEYEKTLLPDLPEASESLEGLTADFLQARYSRAEISPAQAEHSRSAWERLRQALRVRQKSSRASEEKAGR
ncbi:MAG: DUF4129 domain-containing protein [Anaerolineales bacterium]